VKAFGLSGKAGRPRYMTNPLIVPVDETEEVRDTYTPIEAGDDNRNESTLSRMSIAR
jgi:hypothetical protein